MSKQINLAEKIEKSLPAELVALIRKAATVAGGKNMQLYLVGGIVRDLLLGQTNFDLDLVVEGDAIALTKELAEKVGGKLIVHLMFNTAKLTLAKWNIDIAMARTETYAKPGVLPSVKSGTLKSDLFRRDFTINAMAVCISLDNYGELIDLYGGLKDLDNKLIRVLREKSFIDDATRIWRAIRYEQRLSFQIELETLKLLKRDMPMLKTVGGYRLRHELELALAEKEPEKILLRTDELGVLKELNPSLIADDWLASKFKEARESTTVPQELYLSIMTARLKEQSFADFAAYLRFTQQKIEKIREIQVK